uniref:Ependymin n=1 Tax=Myripristis murdjan TaxID=586833 RepID=A0A667Z8Y2_9TELE
MRHFEPDFFNSSNTPARSSSSISVAPTLCVIDSLLSLHCLLSLSLSLSLLSLSLPQVGADGAIMSTGRIKYDAFGQRVLVRNLVTAGNHTFSVEHLMLFKQNVYYEMDWSRFSCQKKKLDPSFIPMQVPADANHMGQVVIGSLSSWGMGVTVNTWYGALPPNGMYMHVFTDAGCFPATLLAFTPESGWTAVSTYNWVLGTTDPMDFLPPFFCGKSQLEETEKADTFFTALESLAKQSTSKQ